MSANNTPDISVTVQRWADIVIDKWHKQIDLLGIRDGGDLAKSFKNYVTWAADGNIDKITFAFEYYGKFVDMGVGKGVNLENRFMKIAAGLTTRRPKHWFSDTFYKQLAALRHLVSERLAEQTQFMISQNIADNADKHKPLKILL